MLAVQGRGECAARFAARRMAGAFIRVAIALMSGVAAAPALADTMYASLETGTVRSAGDFSHPFAYSDIATLTRTYDSGFSWTAFLQNARMVQSGRSSWAVEGLAGYRYRWTESFSIYGTAGAGELFSPVQDFPYLTARAGMDWAVTKTLTWNIVNLRHRSDVQSDFSYRASVAGTGLTYRMSDEFAIYTRVFLVWDTRFHFDGTGLALGLRKYF
jgi:hypothetical protein